MKKIILSLFLTNLLLFSSTFTYACNYAKNQPDKIKKDSNSNALVIEDIKMADQNFINDQFKEENQLTCSSIKEHEVKHLSSKQETSDEQNLNTNDLIDQLNLLNKLNWQFIKDAQVKDLIAKIEENNIYQDLITKLNSPVEIVIFDNDVVQEDSIYLQMKLYVVSLKYIDQNSISLYPKIKTLNFNANVLLKPSRKKRINEEIANKYCDLISFWNQDNLRLDAVGWNGNLSPYNVLSLIETIKNNAKIYSLIDNAQLIDDLTIFITCNNQTLNNNDYIEEQLYNVEVEVKVGQGYDQVKKWTSFLLDFKKDLLYQEKPTNLILNDDIDEQDEQETNLFIQDLNPDSLLDFANITLDKLINSLYNKSYFKDLITDLSLMIISGMITRN